MADVNWGDFKPAPDQDIQNLVSAITHVESKGNASATSSQGAQGSMQIMPATFQQYAAPGQDDFGNDAHRRTAAVRKIVDDYIHFGGDVAKTAAAYVGGRGAVRPDGTIRDDVADANGTTPAAYADMVVGRIGKARAQPAVDWTQFTPVQEAGGGRGKVNPPAVDANAPAPDMSPVGPPAPPDDFDPLSSGGPEIAQALQDQKPAAGGGRGFVNPPAIGEPTKDVGPGESLVRGWVGAGGAAARAVALVPGLLGVAVDSVTNAITGGDSTTAQDAMFRQLVDPAQRAIDWAELKPDEKQGTLAKITSGLGAMLQDLPQMFASGSLKAGTAVAEAAPTVGRFVEQAISHGFEAMRPMMLKAGTDRAQQVLDHGGGIDQAVIAATTEALATGMQGAQPMSAEGTIAKRVATGVPVGIIQSEANRSVSNAASPDYMQQPFSPENALVGGVTNAIVGGAMGHHGGPLHQDRIDLGYDPITGKTPVAAAVQAMGNPMERSGPKGAQAAGVEDVMNAGSVEDAVKAAAEVAGTAGPTDIGKELRSIRPVAPVDPNEGTADGADAEVPPVPAGAGGPGSADGGTGLDVRVGGDGADVRAVEPTGDAGAPPADAAPLGGERGADAVEPPVPEVTGNPFRLFLMRNGVALHLAKDFAPGTKERLAMGRTFRGNGLELDALAERAAEQGFIRSPDDVDHLYDLIGRAVSGERIGPMFGPDAEDELRNRMDRQRQMEQQAARDWELSPPDLDETGFTKADPAVQARVHEIIAQAQAAGVDHESILEDAARITQNGTDHDFLQAAQSALDSALARAGEAGARDRGEGAGQEGREPSGEEAPGLTSPTPDDVIEQQRRRDAGERELAQRRADEEARARADRELPDFGLTGSERPADANPDQGAMFSRTKRPYEVERTPSGSLIARGDKDTIREALGNLPPDALVPTKDGMQVAKQWSDKAQTLLHNFDPAAHAHLDGKKVAIKVDAEDGTHATLKLDAGRALRATDARERELERLRECVGRSA